MTTPALRLKVLDLYEKDFSHAEIAAETGLTRNQVSGILRRADKRRKASPQYVSRHGKATITLPTVSILASDKPAAKVPQ